MAADEGPTSVWSKAGAADADDTKGSASSPPTTRVAAPGRRRARGGVVMCDLLAAAAAAPSEGGATWGRRTSWAPSCARRAKVRALPGAAAMGAPRRPVVLSSAHARAYPPLDAG